MTDHPQSKIEEALSQQFGIKNVTLHYGLTQDELFYAAIENDKGRVSVSYTHLRAHETREDLVFRLLL